MPPPATRAPRRAASAPDPATPEARTSVAPAPLAAELRVALLRSARRLRIERNDEAITDAQYAVLAQVHTHGPATPRALAEHEHVQPPSMTRTVNALEAAGLVTRTGHPDDGRQVLVGATEAGSAEVRATRRRRDAWLTRRLAGLDDHERRVLAEAAQVLRRVVAP